MKFDIQICMFRCLMTVMKSLVQTADCIWGLPKIFHGFCTNSTTGPGGGRLRVQLPNSSPRGLATVRAADCCLLVHL